MVRASRAENAADTSADVPYTQWRRMMRRTCFRSKSNRRRVSSRAVWYIDISLVAPLIECFLLEGGLPACSHFHLFRRVFDDALTRPRDFTRVIDRMPDRTSVFRSDAFALLPSASACPDASSRKPAVQPVL